MRPRHRPKICGLIPRPTRCVLGHRECAKKPEHHKGEENGQSQKNRRSEGSLMDNRSHSVCQSCPGVQTWSFAVIIHLKRKDFQPAVLFRGRVARDCGCEFTSKIAARLNLYFLDSSRHCLQIANCHTPSARRAISSILFGYSLPIGTHSPTRSITGSFLPSLTSRSSSATPVGP